MEKKKTLSFATTPRNIQILCSLANGTGETVSEYIDNLIKEHIDKKQSELMVLARALNVEINEI